MPHFWVNKYMKTYILSAFLVSSAFISNFAFAEVHSKGADGPAAISFFASVLVGNIDPDEISCDEELSSIAATILSDVQNKKLAASANNKNVKNFLKLLGAKAKTSDFLKNAAIEAVDSICSDGEDDFDDEEEVLPED